MSKRFELSRGSFLIGRGTECEVHILDTQASREHARIDQCDEGAMLVDLGSANGTIVNGANARSHFLRKGDWIQIGTTVFHVEELGFPLPVFPPAEVLDAEAVVEKEEVLEAELVVPPPSAAPPLPKKTPRQKPRRRKPGASRRGSGSSGKG